MPQGLEPRLLARGVIETLQLLFFVLVASGFVMVSPPWRRESIPMAGRLRLLAVLLLLVTGAANALFGYVTPWPINGGFGEDDGQYLAIPIAVAHAAIALPLVLAGMAGSWRTAMDRFAVAVTLVWCLWSLAVWTLWTWSTILQIPQGLAGHVYGQAPGDPLVPLALLVAPMMAVGYLIAGWAVFPRRQRVGNGAGPASNRRTGVFVLGKGGGDEGN